LRIVPLRLSHEPMKSPPCESNSIVVVPPDAPASYVAPLNGVLVIPNDAGATDAGREGSHAVVRAWGCLAARHDVAGPAEAHVLEAFG
jgi:hypothetical protein